MKLIDAILEHLKSGRSITSLEAVKLYGATRLAAIIYELRKKGYVIASHIITVPTRYGKDARVAQYTLIEEAEE